MQFMVVICSSLVQSIGFIINIRKNFSKIQFLLKTNHSQKKINMIISTVLHILCNYQYLTMDVFFFHSLIGNDERDFDDLGSDDCPTRFSVVFW